MPLSRSGTPIFLDDVRSLSRYCDSIRGEKVLGIDTEFVRENTFEPILELVQIASADGRIALIDYGTIGRPDGDPLAPILTDPGILKIFHAAGGDLEVLQPLTGAVPAPVWDTQLVTKLFGYEGRTSYADIVEHFLGVVLEDGQTVSDWSRRPLSPEQLQYAAEDVEFLIPLYELEREKLSALGRLTWAEEECAQIGADLAGNVSIRSDEASLYKVVGGAHGLDRRALAVLRELAIWRENEAIRRNRPRRSVMKDDLLIQITRRAPSSISQLSELRNLHPRELQRSGEDILRAVRKGRSLPESECPVPPPANPRLGENESALTALLSAALRALAARHRVASTLIATNADLEQLVRWHLFRTEPPALLSGWRAEVAGKELQALLAGHRRVSWDARARTLVMETDEGDSKQ